MSSESEKEEVEIFNDQNEQADKSSASEGESNDGEENGGNDSEQDQENQQKSENESDNNDNKRKPTRMAPRSVSRGGLTIRRAEPSNESVFDLLKGDEDEDEDDEDLEGDIQAQLQQLEKIHQTNANPIQQETKQVKRSSELLYLDPEEQDPFLINQPNRPWKKPNITKPEASGLLSRVQDFLPQLQQANEDLQEKISEGQDFNIEGVSDEQPYIEMNLSLGLLEETTGSEGNQKPLVEFLPE